MGGVAVQIPTNSDPKSLRRSGSALQKRLLLVRIVQVLAAIDTALILYAYRFPLLWPGAIDASSIVEAQTSATLMIGLTAAVLSKKIHFQWGMVGTILCWAAAGFFGSCQVLVRDWTCKVGDHRFMIGPGTAPGGDCAKAIVSAAGATNQIWSQNEIVNRYLEFTATYSLGVVTASFALLAILLHLSNRFGFNESVSNRTNVEL